MANISYTDAFKRQVKRLSRRYRRIRHDIQPVIVELEEGNILGDQIQSVDYSVYKVRVKNSDANRGKSGGYRIIYYLQSGDEITLIALYSKSDQSDINAADLLSIIQEEGM